MPQRSHMSRGNVHRLLKGFTLVERVVSTLGGQRARSLALQDTTHNRGALMVEHMSDITDRAHQLLSGRVDAIRKLSERQAVAVTAREDADAADRDAASAWTEATQAGWTSTELRKLGLSQPMNRRGGRPKGKRSTTARTTQTPNPTNQD